MILLLPPSEGKMPGGEGIWRPSEGAFGAALGAARRQVIMELPETADQSLKVRGNTALHAQEVNRRLKRAPALIARERYSGVVYQGLDYATLPAKEKRTATNSIVIVSGLMGLARFGDLIPDYRAPMDARLPKSGNLATFWRPHLQQVLEGLARRHIIVDLLPQVHRAAVDPVGRWLRVDVVDSKGSGGHAAKFAKGRLARWLLSHGPYEIESWRDDNWRATVR